MSESGDIAKQYSLPPPSYEEAVHGVPPPETLIGIPRVTNTPIHTPQPLASQNIIEHHRITSQNSGQQIHTPQPLASQNIIEHHRITSQMPLQHQPPYAYHVCPPGTEPLRNLHEILVYPSKGRVYKIKDHNKMPIMIAKEKWEGDCCDSCTCDASMRFSLFTLNEVYAAQAICLTDSVNCCSYNQQHLEVMAPPDVSLGAVWVKSQSRCTVVNQSGDLLYTLSREKDCCQQSPYQIFSASGREMGHIDNTRGIKNRLTLPSEMPIEHKILLLFFTLFMQREEDTQRRSNS